MFLHEKNILKKKTKRSNYLSQIFLFNHLNKWNFFKKSLLHLFAYTKSIRQITKAISIIGILINTTYLYASTPLTVSLDSAPAVHNGIGSFHIRFRFSTDIMISRLDFPSAITVINATVLAARRINGDGSYWEIDVKPHYFKEIQITLEANQDCSSAGNALCTYDRKPLSNQLEVIVKAHQEEVNLDPFFNIELIFYDDNISHALEYQIRAAANHWEDIIMNDIPDFTSSDDCNYPHPLEDYFFKDHIDDLRIYVSFTDVGYSYAILCETRTSGLPASGRIFINKNGPVEIMDSALHEIGHVLGIGMGPQWNSFVKIINGKHYFTGPLAVKAFNNAKKGLNYPAIPLALHGRHWSHDVMYGEKMNTAAEGKFLSAITIQALADMGYVVDATLADAYTLRSFNHLKIKTWSQEIGTTENNTAAKH